MNENKRLTLATETHWKLLPILLTISSSLREDHSLAEDTSRSPMTVVSFEPNTVPLIPHARQLYIPHEHVRLGSTRLDCPRVYSRRLQLIHSKNRFVA